MKLFNIFKKKPKKGEQEMIEDIIKNVFGNSNLINQMAKAQMYEQKKLQIVDKYNFLKHQKAKGVVFEETDQKEWEYVEFWISKNIA